MLCCSKTSSYNSFISLSNIGFKIRTSYFNSATRTLALFFCSHNVTPTNLRGADISLIAFVDDSANQMIESPILRKTISEPQTGIEPATFWWPVRRSNHWATKPQMTSQGASSTYMCDLSGSHYILIMIDEVYMLIYESLEISSDDRGMIVEPYA